MDMVIAITVLIAFYVSGIIVTDLVYKAWGKLMVRIWRKRK